MKQALLVIGAVLLWTQFSFARPVSATIGIRHYGPITKEISDSIRTTAAASLRKEIYIWLKENVNVELDTLNTVKNYCLDKFTERALLSVEEKTFTKGRTWNLSLTVSEGDLREALSAHNGYYGVLIRQNWERYEAAEQSDLDAALSNSIRALSAALLQIGVDTKEPTVETLRRAVQGLFDKIAVKSDVMVIEGKPGAHPVKFPTAKFTIDGAPLTGLHVTAFIQNSRQLSYMTTFIDGTLALDNHVIPFVHNGSMLSIVPDARSYMDAPYFIRFRDLGIRLNRGQELSFIYKVPTLTAALNFKAHSPDKSIEVAREFSSDAHVRKFLKDSCNIQIVSPDAKPDLTIDINMEFIRKVYQEIGDESILMKGKAAFKGGWINKSGETLFEKRREEGTAVEMGPYFLEATSALRALIRKAMYSN
ncbi:MAG: hypothetical protein LBB56_01410 [Chitinispirillales bacterium]|jgi:hypothetical protein|nr:hypothetical protein [Chitinispirillales bacterium]